MQQATRLAALACGLAIVSACDSPTGPNPQFSTIDVDVSECAFGQPFTVNPVQLRNDYFPISPGRQWLFAGQERGDVIELTITVLERTETIGGVQTRVVEERETVNGAPVETSWNYYAENGDGAVCYFGEDVDIFLPDGGVSHDGAWRADDVSHPGNPFFPGIIMPAHPVVRMRFQMEGAPGTAEDEGRITGGGQVKVPAGTYSEALRVREYNPIDGDVGFKTFAKGVGMIVDGPVQLTTCTQGCVAPATAARVSSAKADN